MHLCITACFLKSIDCGSVCGSLTQKRTHQSSGDVTALLAQVWPEPEENRSTLAMNAHHTLQDNEELFIHCHILNIIPRTLHHAPKSSSDWRTMRIYRLPEA